MSTNTTLAGIPFCRIDTRDPLIAQWTIDRITDLRKWSKAAEDEASRALFDESTIRSLLSPFTNDILLVSMLRELPDDLLQPHLSFLAETWTELPVLCAYKTASLLVRHCPDRAVELFLDCLNLPQHNSERLYAILEAAIDLPEPELKRFVEATMALIFPDGATPTFSRVSSFLVANLAWKARHPQAFDIIKIIADAMPDQGFEVLEANQAFLAEILTGASKPITMIQDFFNEYEVPPFVDIPLFFPDSALAGQLDDVVKKLGDLDYQAALDFYEQHKPRLPERVIAVLDMCRDKWLAIPDLEEHEEIAGLFALFPACIAASVWIENPEPPCEDTEAILSFLCTNLETVAINDATVGHFAALEKNRATCCLIEALAKHIDGFGALRIVELMGRLGYRKFIPPLIDNLNSDFGTLCDTIATALRGYGADAAAKIAEALEASPEGRYYYLLDLLMQLSGKQAVIYLENHFNELARSDKEALASAIETIPEQRFIERLAPLTGKGQFLLDRAYLILNRLHGFESEELSALEEEYLEYEAERSERQEAFDDNDPSRMC